MPTVMKLSGVDELLAELNGLAPDLTTEAVALQQDAATDTAAELRAAYPSITGQLRGSVRVLRESSISPARVFTRVEVTAPYAHFYEFGTTRTAAAPTFVPITRRGRERFVRAVIDRVRARGLTIGGAT